MPALSFKLAWHNIHKGKRTYVPFLLASTLSVMMVYLTTSLAENKDLVNMPGGGNVAMMMNFGKIIIIFFTAIFLVYANSFLFKHQQKDLGTLNVLGLPKSGMKWVYFWELLIALLFSLVFGIGLGILLDKAFFLLIGKILGVSVILKFSIPIPVMEQTAIAISFLYLLLFGLALISLSRLDPIELLRSRTVAQRPPKSRWFLTVVGVLCLAGGYGLSVSLQNPMEAFIFFFVAVLLVIVGTYCLFTAGSVTLLNILSKNEKYYYKTSHFLTLSTLKYRLKTNAVSLGNICILSTMILVALSSTFCLWSGLDSILLARYPREICIATNESPATALADIHSVLAENSIPVENLQDWQSIMTTTHLRGNELMLDVPDYNLGDMAVTNFVDLSDWNRLMGEDRTLSPDTVLLYTPSDVSFSTLNFAGKTWNVEPIPSTFNGEELDVYMATQLYVIVPTLADLETVHAWQSDFYGENASPLVTSVDFDVPDDVSQTQVASLIDDAMQDLGYQYTSVNLRESERTDFLSLYGGFLFLGIFVSLLLVIFCVLIMYYKQVSEGLEDARRFQIMSAVGLDKKDITRTIRFQVLLVFFLPLLVASIHLAFAFPMISRLLMMFGFRDTWHFVLVTLVTIGIFACFYFIFYALTSRVYYRLVSEGNLIQTRA